MTRAAQSWLGTAATVAVAVFVTAQAFSAAPKPRRAHDLVVTEGMQPQLATICQMYPAECQFNADGSVARVVARRMVPDTTDRAVLRHFQTEIAPLQDASWGTPR